jgi:predicted nucleotidyltransferase
MMTRAIAWVDSALGSAAKVRILRALSRSPDRWFTEAELARAVAMSPNTVNLAVRELAAAGVVRLLALGRAHQVGLNPSSPMSGVVAELFRSETKAVDTLAEAVQKVLKKGESCVLFGSAARGEMVAGSDVDLLIVAPTWDAAAEASLQIGQAARRLFAAKYRMLHYTPSELRRKWDTPLLQAVRREGVLLAGRPLGDFA